MNYLKLQGREISAVSYNPKFALRLCREYQLEEACVQLSIVLGLWEAAVDLALKVSIDLAKTTASLPNNDMELSKKLWLKIGELQTQWWYEYKLYVIIFFSSSICG